MSAILRRICEVGVQFRNILYLYIGFVDVYEYARLYVRYLYVTQTECCLYSCFYWCFCNGFAICNLGSFCHSSKG